MTPKMLKSRSHGLVSLGLALAIFAIPLAAQQQTARDRGYAAVSLPSYRIIDLGPVGPFGQPFHITANGLISGATSAADGTLRAVLWYKLHQFDISTPGLGGKNSAAFWMNDAAVVVGEAETTTHDPAGEDFCGFRTMGYVSLGTTCLPFIWDPLTGMKGLPTLGGNNGAANAINNRGVVVGMAENTTLDSTCPPYDPALGQYQQYQFRPVVWEHGSTKELSTVGGDPDGIAEAINERGDVAGGTGTCTAFNAHSDLTNLYSLHAVVWRKGKPIDLGNLGGVLPGSGNVAININNRGEAVGGSGTADGSFRAFSWTEETGIRDLGTILGDVASVGLGINDQGVVVGISFDSGFNPRAFVQVNDIPTDLNSLVPGGSPLSLFDACSINTAGEVIGIGLDSNGQPHGYLAVPIAKRL